MNQLETFVRRVRLLAVAAAAIGLLVIPSAASAKRHDRSARDRNHDSIPDKWEKRHGLSTKARGVGKADPDGDGLNNRGEYQSRTNPKKADSDRDGVVDANEDPDRDSVDNGNETRERTNPRKADSDRDGVKDGKEDADRDRLNNGGEDEGGTDPINKDTDGDGIEDGDEHAGEIVSFDGTTLTISVFGGDTVTGTVDENTYIDCGDDAAGDDSAGDDPGADDSGDDLGGDDSGDDALPRIAADDGADDAGDDGADDGSGDDGADDGSDDSADDDGSGDEGDDSGDDSVGGCSTDTLTVGTEVTEAAVSVTPDGTFFDAIELGQ